MAEELWTKCDSSTFKAGKIVITTFMIAVSDLIQHSRTTTEIGICKTFSVLLLGPPQITVGYCKEICEFPSFSPQYFFPEILIS